MPDEKPGSGLHHWIRLEIAKITRLPQAPCEHDGKRNLVQLNAPPIGGSINPEVLREASIRLLRARQVHQCPACSSRGAACQQRGHTVNHVARPHQVIAAEVVVALGLSPRNTRRGYDRANKSFVFMCEKQAMANAVEAAAVARTILEVHDIPSGAAPLLEILVPMLRKGHTQRLEE